MMYSKKEKGKSVMSKRKHKNDKIQVLRHKINNMSKEEIIEIQAESYYRALKRIEDEKAKADETKKEKKRYKWYENVLFALNVFFFPWKVNKKFCINNQIYDGILLIIVSLLMQIIGSIIWLYGIYVIIHLIYKSFLSGINSGTINSLSIAVLSILFGSIFILAGDEFSKETDSNKIYAYSASIVALISCVVSIIALVAK